MFKNPGVDRITEVDGADENRFEDSGMGSDQVSITRHLLRSEVSDWEWEKGHQRFEDSEEGWHSFVENETILN